MVASPADVLRVAQHLYAAGETDSLLRSLEEAKVLVGPHKVGAAWFLWRAGDMGPRPALELLEAAACLAEDE
jgi:hypothetical protein